MAKKTFTAGLNSLLGENPAQEVKAKAKRGRPKTNTKIVTNSAEEGTIEGETRATFILPIALLEQIKAIAYWERVTIKTVTTQALEAEVARYTKASGKIKPIPNK